MTAHELEQIAAIVEHAISQTLLRPDTHVCRLPVSDKEIKDLTIHIEAVRELGNGDLMVGMHKIRDNHEFTEEMRTRINKVSSVSFYAILVALCGAIGAGMFKVLKIIIANMTHGV
jgi:hypothetical protein